MSSRHCYSSFRTESVPEIDFIWRVIFETYNISTLQLSPSLGHIPVSCDTALLYVAGLSGQLYQIYMSHNVHMCHQPATILRSVVVHLKNRTPKEHQCTEHQCRTIYNMTCDTDSSHTYIGETKRPLSRGEWRSHGRAPDCQSRGRCFNPTYSRFENLAISSPHICLCLSEERLKSYGPFCLLSMPGEVKDPTQGVNV